MNMTDPPGEGGGLRERVQRWECPYCRSFSGASASAVRRHVRETDDETHSVTDLDRHVPGYDDGALVAVWPADGADPVPIDEVDSVPGATEVVADAGTERLGVDRWVCPYCDSYTNDTEQGIRSHVTGTTDAAHAGKSGWNPDRPIEGFDADGDVVARITASADGAESVVVPAGEDADQRTTAYSSGEGIRGEKKVRLINAYLAAPDAHYSDLAEAADTTPRYAHRVKNKLEDGEIAEGAVREVADEDLKATFAARLAGDDDGEPDERPSDPAQALAAAGVDPSGDTGHTRDEPVVPLSEVERVRDMMEMYRREAEFEADSATTDDTLAARAETKEFVASQAIEMLERAIESAERPDR